MRPSPRLRHLYVHFPFCVKVCPYCAFDVERGGSARAQASFVTGISKELQLAQNQYLIELKTLYWGGGTPSLLTPENIAALARVMPISAKRSSRKIEWTLEANPITVTDARAEAWARAGINRISLGAQSFDPAELSLLGRDHSPDQVTTAVRRLRAHGFSNISVDLIFALPGQTLKTWTRNLDAALACEPEHISCYALTYEPGTPFERRRQAGEFTVNETREGEMLSLAAERLTAAGLPPYETSNYARSGYESAHNRAYWLGKDYLGLGPGAWSTVGRRRWKNRPGSEAYLAALKGGLPLAVEEERLTPKMRRLERIMLGLRMREGVPVSYISKTRAKKLQELAAEGIVKISAGTRSQRITLTPHGRLVVDSVAEALSE